MREDGALRNVIGALAGELSDLQQRAVWQYQPVVDDILLSRSRDIQHIEHTLDGLLDFCGHEPVLRLFKQLCRYYWDVDPVATVGYVNAYREYWDSDGEDGQR